MALVKRVELLGMNFASVCHAMEYVSGPGVQQRKHHAEILRFIRTRLPRTANAAREPMAYSLDSMAMDGSRQTRAAVLQIAWENYPRSRGVTKVVLARAISRSLDSGTALRYLAFAGRELETAPPSLREVLVKGVASAAGFSKVAARRAQGMAGKSMQGSSGEEHRAWLRVLVAAHPFHPVFSEYLARRLHVWENVQLAVCQQPRARF